MVYMTLRNLQQRRRRHKLHLVILYAIFWKKKCTYVDDMDRIIDILHIR